MRIFATRGFDPGAQPRTTVGQLKVADVGAMQAEELGLGTTGHQLLQPLAAMVLGIGRTWL